MDNAQIGFHWKYLLIPSGRYKVIFFGTFETGTLKADSMWPYNPVTKAKFVSRNLQKLGFREAMAQIENTPEIIALEGVGVLEAVAKEGGGDGEEVPEVCWKKQKFSKQSMPSSQHLQGSSH